VTAGAVAHGLWSSHRTHPSHKAMPPMSAILRGFIVRAPA
jgi:hypothetical protein